LRFYAQYYYISFSELLCLDFLLPAPREDPRCKLAP